MMNDDPTQTGGRHGSYFDAMRQADADLDDALSHVRAEQDAGNITLLQACAERCELLERHIALCKRLRLELGGQP